MLMREGRLGYNCENRRYGLLSMDLWIDTGFHCKKCMEGSGRMTVTKDQNGNESAEMACWWEDRTETI